MEQFILGLDKTEFGFIMDVRNKVVSMENEEISPSVHNSKMEKIKLTFIR